MPQDTERGRFLLIYGSQTGQAKAIAEEVAETAAQHGLFADLHCLSMTEKRFWLEREKLAVIISSTTGDGEVPDTAQKFWRRLRKRTLPENHLQHLTYGLLGLGDSNYTNFCKCGRMLDRRLEELGAARLLPSVWGDDAIGLEIAVEPWIDSLWPALRDHLGLPPEEGSVSNDLDTPAMINGICEGAAGDTAASINTNMEDNSVKIPKESFEDSDVKLIVESPADNLSSTLTEVINDKTQLDSNSTSDSTAQNKQEPEVPKSELSLSDSRAPNQDGEEETPSLTHSLPPLAESSLTLPMCPAAFLDIQYHEEESLDTDTVPLQNGCPFPSAKSAVYYAPVANCSKLTADDAVKTALRIQLDLSDCEWRPQPGDSFSVVCPNDPDEVNDLLQRLDVSALADTVCTLHVKKDTKKRSAAVPEHCPPKCTLRHLLTTCCDIRVVPKKAFLRALVEHTTNPRQKRRLQELCSKQGMSHYSTYIREQSISVMDILAAFPSCNPPMECILEHLPRLQPRPYSAASSSLATPNQLQFVFNVINVPAGQGRFKDRQGVCTGWLERLTMRCGHARDSVQLAMDRLSIAPAIPVKIPIFLRTNQHFRPPHDLSTPLIMIGPGTGVAPFIGFLQHREAQLRTSDSAVETIGQSWLLFGCRHRDRDFLFQEELENFVENGTLSKLLVSFSRDENQNSEAPRYVQDSMLLHGDDLVDLLEVKGAHVYVCGDARNMAKNVQETFVQLLQKCKGLEKKDAEVYMMKLRLDRRYLEDVWT